MKTTAIIIWLIIMALWITIVITVNWYYSLHGYSTQSYVIANFLFALMGTYAIQLGTYIKHIKRNEN